MLIQSIDQLSCSFQVLGVALNGILWPGDIEQSIEMIQQSSDEKYNKIFTILYSVSHDLDLFNTFQVNFSIFSVASYDIHWRNGKVEF